MIARADMPVLIWYTPGLDSAIEAQGHEVFLPPKIIGYTSKNK